MFSTFSVHYQSITQYRFGRPATDGKLLYETCDISTVSILPKSSVSVIFNKNYEIDLEFFVICTNIMS